MPSSIYEATQAGISAVQPWYNIRTTWGDFNNTSNLALPSGDSDLSSEEQGHTFFFFFLVPPQMIEVGRFG